MNIGLVSSLFGDRMEQFALSAPENTLARGLEQNGHIVHRFPSGTLPDVSVDVYHANFFCEAATYLALRRVHPLVYSPHDGFEMCGFDNMRGALDKPLKTLIFRSSDVVIALSELEADFLQSVYSVDRKKICIVPNGVHASSYLAGPLPAYNGPTTPIKLLSVGQLEEFKGHLYLLKALQIVIRKFPNVHLVIVSHNARLLSEYQRLCAEQKLEAHVQFETAKATNELISYYSSCDIFVQPSLVDNFPITVLEAMASARPILASGVGSVSEQLAEGSGILAPPGDADELARLLCYMIENPEIRTRLGAQALKRVNTLYIDELVVKKHIDAYQQAIDSFVSRNNRLSIPQTIARMLMATYKRRSYVGRLVRLPSSLWAKLT